MSRKILIIGSGIAGLTAGIYAQKHGFSSVIYEQHTQPGGLCTGWDHGPFHVDGCIHWLTGSNLESDLGKIWQETHALDPDIPIKQPEALVTVEHDGMMLSLYRDLERLRDHLLDCSPDDQVEINRFCDAIAVMQAQPIPVQPPDLLGFVDQLKSLWRSRQQQQVMKQFSESLGDYAKRFHHPAIQKALVSVIPASYSTYALLYTMGTLSSGNGGRPAGGSRAMARRMADYYQELGGQLVLNQPVERILIENGRTTGVALWHETDDLVVDADYVIAATDLHVTLYTLLEGLFPAAQIEMRDADPITYPTPTCVYISYAIDDSLLDIPQVFDIPVSVFPFEDQSRDRIMVRHYADEPTFAPPGKNVLTVMLPADYHWWDELDENAYQEEKEKLAGIVLERIVEHFPKLHKKIQCLDIATPLTYERYCSAWRGAWMAYGPTPSAKRLFLRGGIKRIQNLYMAGQWLMPPGGLPVAALTGRWAIQRICINEKKDWQA